MKRIEEAVQRLPREELESMARENIFDKMLRLKNVLCQTNADAKRGEGGKTSLDVDTSYYALLKTKITSWGLWCPEYDEDYAQAIKGELINVGFKGRYIE